MQTDGQTARDWAAAAAARTATQRSIYNSLHSLRITMYLYVERDFVIGISYTRDTVAILDYQGTFLRSLFVTWSCERSGCSLKSHNKKKLNCFVPELFFVTVPFSRLHSTAGLKEKKNPLNTAETRQRMKSSARWQREDVKQKKKKN